MATTSTSIENHNLKITNKVSIIAKRAFTVASKVGYCRLGGFGNYSVYLYEKNTLKALEFIADSSLLDSKFVLSCNDGFFGVNEVTDKILLDTIRKLLSTTQTGY